MKLSYNFIKHYNKANTFTENYKPSNIEDVVKDMQTRYFTK